MNSDRLLLQLEEIETAASNILKFVIDMDEAAFLSDERTQMAVMMGLAIIGEAVVKIVRGAPEFLRQHTDIPWTQMKGMRNLIVHDYFRAEMSVVWKTVTESIPELQERLATIRNWRAQGE
ncbi:HepT-like ribonuclease domain-containing protein [Agrobacterium larrymoorei]|uniref:HepT-like ribonuclease domain-containing protein n=1 Tax=Agrobacterium larrymoorei TaxID=160699 RepID=UPI0030BD62E4